MSEWYYAKGGVQHGPVDGEKLKVIIRGGSLDMHKDLVWREGMGDWIAPALVPELQGVDREEVGMVPLEGGSPGGSIARVEGRSLDVMGCLRSAFELTKENAGGLLLVFMVYLLVSIGASFALGYMDEALGLGHGATTPETNLLEMPSRVESFSGEGSGSVLNFIISTVINVFLGLGLTRVSLNVVEGLPFGVSTIFGEGRLLLKGMAAYILMAMALLTGFLLLIVPGIVLLARLGFYQTALVDQGLGPINALTYSWKITRGSTLKVLLLLLISITVILAGCALLGVGLLFAIPMISIMWVLGYRQLQSQTAEVAATPKKENSGRIDSI